MVEGWGFLDGALRVQWHRIPVKECLQEDLSQGREKEGQEVSEKEGGEGRRRE